MTDSNGVIATLLAVGGRVIEQSDRELAGKLEAWLAMNHEKVLAVLNQGATGRFTRKDVNVIPAELFQSFAPASTAARMTGILANAIDQVNQVQKKRNLPLPPIGQLRRRRKSPWPVSILASKERATSLVSVIEEMIKAGIPAASDDDCGHLALVIPSAILFGGVLHRDTLAAVVRACADPANSWNHFGQRLQLDLRISWRREADAERRFWFPDVLTALLLMRFRTEIAREAHSGLAILARGDDASDAAIGNWIWTKVLGPFRHAARASGTKEKSLHQLLEAAASRYRMAVPEVLVAYMTREILSSSLPKSALARVHGLSIEDAVDAPPPDGIQGDGKEVDREPGLVKHDFTVVEADWLDEIRSALRGTSKKGIRSNLQVLAERYRPGPAKRFAEFGTSLLGERSAFGRRLHLSTVKTYTRVLIVRLGGILDNKDPAKRSSAELLSDYLDVLEEVSDGGRRKSLRLTVARAINEFHVFLCRTHGVGPIRPAELGLGRAASSAVDAGLVTESEYYRIAAYIRGYTGAVDDATIVPGALLLLQLGFRAGVRRDENRHLRMCDLLLAGPGTTKVAEILIRPWGTHELKSANAIRRIPTELLFDREENLRLENWVAEKMQVKSINNETLLFDFSGSEAVSTSFHRMISLVVSAMRKVTGDPHLRFHHLRHSAASALFTRFMLHGAQISPRRWPAQLMPLPKNAPLAAKLYQALTDSSGPTRKALFAIARLTGHSDPDTDCGFYIHAFDGLQAIFLENSSLAPAKDLLVAATSLKPAQAYKLLKRAGPWALANRHAPRVWPQPTSSARRLEASGPQPRLWVDELYDFLILSEAHSAEPIEDFAPDHGIDPVHAMHMIDRARKLRDMSTSNHTLKFEMETQRHPREKRLYTPRRPHLVGNRELAQSLALGIEHALEVSPAESQKAIKIWIDRVKLKDMQIIFKRLDQVGFASDFRKFLDRAGIAFRWIGFDRDPESRWIARWRRELRIDRSIQVEIQDPPPHSGRLAYRWFAIEPSFPSVTERAGKSRVNGKEGFRYLMVMAAIYAAAGETLTLNVGAKNQDTGSQV
jgi:integrase